MLIGYARVSKSDDSQVLDLQIDTLLQAGVNQENIYTDKISGTKDERPGLESCLKALREEDILVVWKLDRLGRNLKHLINTIDDLNKRNIGFKVLSGQGVNIDTTYRDWETDRKSTRLNSSHSGESRMPSSA